MKKGIILSSLFLFILASTAGKDFLFHFSDPESDVIIDESGDSPVSDDESRFLVCEDSEEMEGRNRVHPILLILDNTICTATIIRSQHFTAGNTLIHETFLVFLQPLRAPPAVSIV